MTKGELSYIEDGDGTQTSQIRKELDHLLSQTSSFETLANSLLSKRKFLLLQRLNAVMACALTPPINDDPKVDDSFVEKPDAYDDFLTKNSRNIDGLQNAHFITLNYDCLLERAICRRYEQPLAEGQQCLCSHVNYRLDEKTTGIEILKPHGSINWVADTILGDGHIEESSPIPMVGSIRQDSVMEWTKIDVVPSAESHTDIVLAHYALNKIPQANPDLLEKIRGLALQRATEASSITLIGIHIPDNPSDDPFLNEMFRVLNQKAHQGLIVNYINPAPTEIDKAASWGFRTKQMSFQHYVSELS